MCVMACLPVGDSVGWAGTKLIILSTILLIKAGCITPTPFPPGHSSYTTTAKHEFFTTATDQPATISSSSSSGGSGSAFQFFFTSSSTEQTPPKVLTGDTTVSFSVTSGDTTAYCDLSFATDFTCISYAEVGCTLVSQGGTEPGLGQVDHAWQFISKIDGVAYNIDALLTFHPSQQTIASLVLCFSPTCSYSSSSSGVQDTCMDYPRLCGSSSSSSSSSSPIHSPYISISSSYASYDSSSSSSFSSSSSSSSSVNGEGMALIFGSSPTVSSSSSTCSIEDFAWSSGSGVVIAWPSFASSSSPLPSSSSLLPSSSSSMAIPTTTTTTPTTTFTTNGVITNSRGSVVTAAG